MRAQPFHPECSDMRAAGHNRSPWMYSGHNCCFRNPDKKSHVFAHINIDVPRLREKLCWLVHKVSCKDSVDNTILICFIKLLEAVSEKTECSCTEYSACTTLLMTTVSKRSDCPYACTKLRKSSCSPPGRVSRSSESRSALRARLMVERRLPGLRTSICSR